MRQLFGWTGALEADHGWRRSQRSKLSGDADQLERK